MNNVNPEEVNLENEKLRLEIASLRRQLDRSLFWEIFIEKWGPALIAGVILFTLVPLANYIMWKNQKAIEVSNIFLTKKMELYAEAASHGTRFSQLITVINKCYRVRQKQGDVVKEDAALANIKIEDLEKERLEVEARLIKTLREVRIYFGQNASERIDHIRDLYNKPGMVLDENFIKNFLQEYGGLMKVLEEEIRKEFNK